MNFGQMPSLWNRWQNLSARDRRDTLAAAALIPIVHISLKILGVNRTRRLFETPIPATHGDAGVARQTAMAVARAARRGVYAGNCLSQSITLMRLLGTRGIAAELRFGARMEGETLDAHAWVEHGGVPLNDSPGIARRFPIVR